jgi:hypothetical protein
MIGFRSIPMPANRNPIPDELRKKLDTAHGALLRVHKSLIDHERVAYESARGPIPTPLEFLEIVMNDSSFAWLRSISALIVGIDEFIYSRHPRDPKEAEALLSEAKQLLVPREDGTEFQRRYHQAIQSSSQVAGAHAEWRSIQP